MNINIIVALDASSSFHKHTPHNAVIFTTPRITAANGSTKAAVWVVVRQWLHNPFQIFFQLKPPFPAAACGGPWTTASKPRRVSPRADWWSSVRTRGWAPVSSFVVPAPLCVFSLLRFLLVLQPLQSKLAFENFVFVFF